MVDDSRAFSSYSVDDVAAAKELAWSMDPAGNVLSVMQH
jgi:hypothetical protein